MSTGATRCNLGNCNRMDKIVFYGLHVDVLTRFLTTNIDVRLSNLGG